MLPVTSSADTAASFKVPTLFASSSFTSTFIPILSPTSNATIPSSNLTATKAITTNSVQTGNKTTINIPSDTTNTTMSPPSALNTPPPLTLPTPPSLHINTSKTTVSSTSEAIRTHTYWTGFYKKTIKERRTQLGLAFPHLSCPTSLDSFASTQNSTKTSSVSTPNLEPTVAMAAVSSPMIDIIPSTAPSPLSASSCTATQIIPRPLSVLRLSPTMLFPENTSTGNHIENDNISDEENSTSINSKDVNIADNDNILDTTTMYHTSQPQQQEQSQLPKDKKQDKRRASNLVDHGSNNQFLQQQPSVLYSLSGGQYTEVNDEERRALALELAQGQEDVSVTEEERRDQFEKERKATVITNLQEQRKMIGSPNHGLLEGDLSLDARLDAIIATERDGAVFPIYGLDEEIANNMIENCIGTMGLPLGLAFNFTINGSPLTVPMAIEEPSVVAAVSSAAKTISAYQGFQAWAPERNMIIAQVQLLDILDQDMDHVIQKMKDHEQYICREANEYCTNMVLRGGGVQQVTFHRVRRHRTKDGFKGQDLLVKYGIIPASSLPARDSKPGSSASIPQGRCSEWLVVHLHIDVGDAMGANCANTVAEGIAPCLAKLSGGRVGVRILSNLNVDRVAKSTFRLPFSHMVYKSLPGKDVAVRILEAYEWAELDPYRAATHNKGIMNGIDAVALATGQDWRAIEAGAHAWASGAGTYSEHSSDTGTFSSTDTEVSQTNSGNDGHGIKRKARVSTEEALQAKIFRGDAYKPLTRYWIEEDEDRVRQGYKGQDALVFCGELKIPIMVGTKGGVLSTNPVHAFALGVMRYPDSKQLAMAMVTVGLAQNFAALRALATEGIQRGHMSLHARNIAISAGTPPASVEEVTAFMVDKGKIRISAAKSYLEERGISLYNSDTGSNSSNTSPGSGIKNAQRAHLN
ncbi:hypothetical protein BCR41DRAFT_422973 [Lobosporangium transversale]|uniref:hydroxymethylglutaryl-CoA reductase (NADPH) n=1 Tax=Lobosporangium transversale TaxID=64571 RepID=A0A1Y2GL57_9FUNG|nr:hypothetical protein BCR41DRAFT_422973 [Lobosporangium transversale]ORZ12883.1 hypothetical protein BCR41DRAFT_422973 [Lobosporangium transversale]|eukprot:XP_021880232.1 hypothetical protein BCR41DRAFT_422973 [Lobosporangium transversale]